MNSSHWKVPVRAERYRFKLASTPMTLSIVKSEPGLKRFHEGINISDEPTPNQSGTIQRYPIAHENTLEPNPNNYIAARYLERGPALPAPEQSKSSTEAPSFEDKGIPWTSPRRLLQTAGSAVTLALILMLWKRRKASSNSPLVILLLAVSIAGCQPESYEEISIEISQTQPIREAITNEGNYTVRYVPNPSPLPLNEHFTIEVEVTPKANDQKAIEIEVDADMPAHGHGINTAPTIRNEGSGKFIVDGLLFHMKGEWELYIDILDGPVRERAVFPITL